MLHRYVRGHLDTQTPQTPGRPDAQTPGRHLDTQTYLYSNHISGIAAANVEIDGTDVAATTIHELFQMDGDFQTSLDLAQLSHSKVKTLVELEVLLLDECSMLDGDGYSAIEEILSITDHNRRPNAGSHDAIGNMHLLLFGDFKQLPPATSKPSFIVIPAVTRHFEFRCLRENRRVVTGGARREIEDFHQILSDISWGISSDVVKNFIVQAYVRGAVVGNAENCELENSTAVFTKRRYRDKVLEF